MRALVALILAGACTAAQARNNDMWELNQPQFQKLEATANSRAVRKLLSEPIERGLERAEAARVALNIFRRTEEARLLNDYMEHAVVAELLGLTHAPAETVGEAIEQQKAKATPVSAELAAQAMRVAQERGARTNDHGRVFLQDRPVMFGPDGISFGVPANRKDSPRAKAHEFVFAADCAERGTCLSVTAYFQSPGGHQVRVRTIHFVAVLLGGPILVWAMIRAIGWLPLGEGAELGPLWPLAFLLAPPIPVIAWFVAVLQDKIDYARGWGLGVLGIAVYGILMSYAVAAVLLPPILVILWRQRRLTFVRIVLAGTALGIVLPPAWRYLALGAVASELGARFPRDVELILYAVIVTIVFGLLSWPRRTPESAGPAVRMPQWMLRLIWFAALVGMHCLLLAYAYTHSSGSYHFGIFATSLVPWLPMSWLDAGTSVRIAWCAAVWLLIYWLLAWLIARPNLGLAALASPQRKQRHA